MSAVEPEAVADLLDAVSPELALIDPELRKRLLSVADQPVSGLRPRRPAPAAQRSAPTAAPLEPTLDPRPRHISRRHLAVFASLAVFAAALGALTNGGSSSSPPGPVSVGSGSTSPAARGATPIPADGKLRFAWPPTKGATSYLVAFYDESGRVLDARTRSASISIRIGAKSRTGAQTLVPGAYQWYVWPVRNARVDPVAVVRSQFVARS